MVSALADNAPGQALQGWVVPCGRFDVRSRFGGLGKSLTPASAMAHRGGSSEQDWSDLGEKDGSSRHGHVGERRRGEGATLTTSSRFSRSHRQSARRVRSRTTTPAAMNYRVTDLAVDSWVMTSRLSEVSLSRPTRFPGRTWATLTRRSQPRGRGGRHSPRLTSSLKETRTRAEGPGVAARPGAREGRPRRVSTANLFAEAIAKLAPVTSLSGDRTLRTSAPARRLHQGKRPSVSWR